PPCDLTPRAEVGAATPRNIIFAAAPGHGVDVDVCAGAAPLHDSEVHIVDGIPLEDVPPAYVNKAPAPPRCPLVPEENPAPKTYRALCGYDPRRHDEIALSLGDEIIVRSQLPDGWANIDNLTTGTSGVAPLSAIDSGKDFL
ncbi:hypothetical protein BDK51DRAFT_38491, partial [Blyttiomyces helicus]